MVLQSFSNLCIDQYSEGSMMSCSCRSLKLSNFRTSGLGSVGSLQADSSQLVAGLIFLFSEFGRLAGDDACLFLGFLLLGVCFVKYLGRFGNIVGMAFSFNIGMTLP